MGTIQPRVGGKVFVVASMSLDGFVADPSDDVGPLFDWYGNGDVDVISADPDRVFHTTAATRTTCARRGETSPRL